MGGGGRTGLAGSGGVRLLSGDVGRDPGGSSQPTARRDRAPLGGGGTSGSPPGMGTPNPSRGASGLRPTANARCKLLPPQNRSWGQQQPDPPFGAERGGQRLRGGRGPSGGHSTAATAGHPPEGRDLQRAGCPRQPPGAGKRRGCWGARRTGVVRLGVYRERSARGSDPGGFRGKCGTRGSLNPAAAASSSSGVVFVFEIAEGSGYKANMNETKENWEAKWVNRFPSTRFLCKEILGLQGSLPQTC